MKLSTFQANHRFLHFIDMSLFVGPSEVPFYGDGVPFYRDLLWFVGPGPPFYRDGVPFYRCPTSSPPGPHVHVSVYGTVCVYVYVQYMLCIGMCVHVLGSWFYSKRVLSVLFCFRPAQQNMNWSWGIVVSSPCCLQCCHSVQPKRPATDMELQWHPRCLKWLMRIDGFLLSPMSHLLATATFRRFACMIFSCLL